MAIQKLVFFGVRDRNYFEANHKQKIHQIYQLLVKYTRLKKTGQMPINGQESYNTREIKAAFEIALDGLYILVKEADIREENKNILELIWKRLNLIRYYILPWADKVYLTPEEINKFNETITPVSQIIRDLQELYGRTR